MTLSQRLTTLFDDGSNAYYRHKGIGSAEAYDNKKEADVQRTIATIEADLKGLLPKFEMCELCNDIQYRCSCADAYNKAIAEMAAAIEHYTRDKTQHEHVFNIDLGDPCPCGSDNCCACSCGEESHD